MRQLPELINQMNSATIEGQLDSWLQYPDGDLSQHSLAKAVAKPSKKSCETGALSDKIALLFKIARERKDTDPHALSQIRN